MKHIHMWCLVGAAVSLAAGCSDLNDLGGQNQHADTFEDGDTYTLDGPDFPTAAGTQVKYLVSRQYTPDITDKCGGLSKNERQLSGEMCLEVTSINDRWTDNLETLANSLVRVTAFGGGSALDITGSDDVNCEPMFPPEAEVLEAVSGLWLSDLVPLTSTHPYYPTEQSVAFKTRGPLTPPDQAITSVFFFDSRTSENELWTGWSDPGTVDGATNFVGRIVTYFYERLGLTDFMDKTKLDYSFKEAVAISCDANTTFEDCQAVIGCRWDFTTEGCVPANVDLQFVWRENLTEGPAGLLGDVVHQLRVEYSLDGMLTSYDEIIAKDGPGAPLELEFLTQCPAWSLSCAQGKISSYFGDYFTTASCTF